MGLVMYTGNDLTVTLCHGCWLTWKTFRLSVIKVEARLEPVDDVDASDAE